LITSICYPQNTDSLQEDLYKKGLISRELYYQTRLDKNVIRDAKVKIGELRKQLKYKSALDVVVQETDSESIVSALYNDNIQKIAPIDSGALEAFIFNQIYQVYSYLSFDGKDTLLLIAECLPRFIGFYLISNGPTQSILLDQIKLSREGSFEFATINGGNIIKVEDRVTGTGLYGHRLTFLTINNRRFVQQFQCYLLTMSMSQKTITRTISDIQYKDINDDGYLDLTVTTKKDLLNRNEKIDFFNDDELKKAKSIKELSVTINKYIWQKQTLTFQPQH
jgi:hypothetical protein